MTSVEEKLAGLSPERLALLEKMRRAKRAAAAPPAAGPPPAPATPPFSLISAADRALLPPDVEDAYPLTNMQAGMLYHLELTPDYLIYQNVDTRELRVPFDADKIARAIAKVIARHPMLRTGFALTGYSEPLQLVHRAAEPPLEIADLIGRPAAEQRRIVEAYVLDEKRRVFDYGKPPLLRFMVHRLSAQALQLTLTDFHPIVDGWSLNTIWAEVARHYGALLAGHDLPPEPPPPVEFRDFVALELAAARSAETAEFWRQVLAGPSGTANGLELPRWPERYRSRPGRPVHAEVALFPPATHAALQRIAQRAGLPQKSLALAVHLEVLARLCGVDEVLAGLTVHGRPEVQGGDQVVGLFFNTVPLRVAADAPSWIELARRAFAAEQELLPHRRYPLGLLQQSWGRQTLLETSFNMTHFHVGAPTSAAGVRSAEPESARATAGGDGEGGGDGGGAAAFLEENNFPLSATFSIDPATDRLSLILACHSNVLGREAFAHLLALYRRAVETFAADPEGSPEAADLLAPAERHQVLIEANDTFVPEPQASFPERFFVHAAAHPDDLAAAFTTGAGGEGREETTYGDLARRALRLAALLRARGVGPEVRVAIALERSLDLLVALLGVLRAGGAYVPLDPAYPRDRIAYVLDDSGAALLLTDEALLARLPELGAGRPALTPSAWIVEPAAASETSNPDRLDRVWLDRSWPDRSWPEPDHLAYVLYTSGSTGRPKGVEVTHRGLVNFLTAMRGLLAFGPGDRLLAVTTISFDIAGLELYLPLLAGGRVEIASRATAADGVALERALRATGATMMQATPATWQMLVEAGWPGDPELTLLCGGEALPRPLAERLLSRGRALWNLYGPTETTIWSAARRVEPGTGAVPIGRPIANNQLILLDRRLALAPIATPGELLIGGSGLARGYHGRADLTAERFVPNPLAGIGRAGAPGSRLYRTGDLARRLPDGEVEFLGRVDHQVKVRGFRIELGEIEAALLAHPAVREAVVVARDDGAGTRLVAYVAARGGEAPPTRELRGFLLETLPDYMVPTLFVTLPALPLTPNGKVDRKALPVPEADRSALAASYVAPRTATEGRVATLMAELLELPRIGVEDAFFELGGHSLLAMRLILKLREAFALELPLQLLFERPTAAGLGAEIDRRRTEGETAAPLTRLPELVPDPGAAHEPFPLTDLQQAYWIGRTGALELGNVSAHTYQELAFPPLDVERLERAWARVVDRHPALRTVILPDGRQQVLAEVPSYRIAVLDLSERPVAEAEAALARVRRTMCDEGPDLAGWPLFELRLTRLADGCRLHVSVSLLISDVVSFGLIAGDLARLYTDPSTALPPLAATVRDYILALERLRASERFERDLAYWRGRLADLPPGPELPLAAAPSTLAASHLARLDGGLPREVWTRVKGEARRAGASATVLAATVFAEVLATYSRHPRFCLNLLALRRLPLHPDVERMVGNFGAPLLLEVDLTAPEPFGQRLRRVQSRLFEDLDHGLVSGIEVLRELARVRGGGAFSSVPVVLASTLDLGGALGEASASGTAEGRLPVHTHLQTPQVWIDYQVFELDGGLAFHAYHVPEIFPAGMIAAMVRAFGDRLTALAEPAAWTAPARALTPAADLALTARVNATAAPEPSTLLHEPYFARAAETPGALAVVCGAERLTYGELDALVRPLAHDLFARGVAPNELVAVVMEKGVEQVAAVLAIDRAGAAYLPIDPGLPAERIAYLLGSTRTRIALTQARVASTVTWPAGVEWLAVPSCSEELAVASWSDELAALPPCPAGRDDLAYVIFTSGSTGLPKGVMIEHRGAANTVADVDRRFAIGPTDRVLALSALSFDLSVWDVFGLLGAGGAIVLPEPDALREPARWEAILRRERVTVWNSVPALLEMLVDDLEARGERLPDDLRLVLLSGDWVPVSLPDRVRRLARADVEIVALGGATEASIWSILYPIADVPATWTSIPYGRPMANQTFAVLDDALEPRPLHVPGQLAIGGIGLARGYYGDEAKTAASFVVHPRTGERLYRTGDLGRWLADGTIEFLGREDQQVKVQGYRIELGEIEAALAGHPDIQAAVVAALGERRGAKRLIGYVVPRGERMPESADLHEFLAAKIPRYMIPTRFVAIEAVPLSQNGKVDRKALPDPDAARARGEHVPPRDDLEFALAGLWQELLGGGPVSVADNFFELGGHSLVAVRLMARIKAAFGRELPLSTLFEAPTVERLAALLRAEGAAERPLLVPIAPQGTGRPFFCVHPVGGSVLGYVELARALGDERPFWALQSPVGDRETTVPELARLYLAALRAVAPHGPYLLGGWSMGGVIAYEMARQLAEAGEETSLVAMIDAAPPDGGARALEAAGPIDDSTLTAWFARDLGALAGVAIELTADELRPLPDADRARLVHARAVAAGALTADLPEAEIERLLATFRRNYRALLAYRAEPFPGRLTLFPARERNTEDPSSSWAELAGGGAEIRPVPGDHYTILRPPHLGALVEPLRAALDRADSTMPPGRD